MKKIIQLLFLGAIILTSVLRVSAEDKPLPKPGVLTEESVMTSKRLSGYDILIIRDLAADGVEYSNINDEEKPKIDAMKPLLVTTFSETLEMELKTRKRFKEIKKNTEANGNAVILEGAFTEFNAGNRAVRFFVGFGAGKTYLKMKGRLIDGQTGQVLATFEDRETGYRGSMTLEAHEDLFPHQAKSLGENVASFLEKLY